jgi:WD40 repeat protein
LRETRVHDAATGAALGPKLTPGGIVVDAAFSPDGRFLLTWERVPILHVWDPDSGRLLHTLKHNERVEHADLNPAVPRVVATGGGDNTIRVWDLDNGKLLVQLHQPQWAAWLAFSRDGSELITGCSHGLIRSWDWRTGALKRGLPHNPEVASFDFTADRRTLVVQGWSSLEVTDWPSGSPLGPAPSLRDPIHWGVDISAGDRRAGAAAARFLGPDKSNASRPERRSGPTTPTRARLPVMLTLWEASS